MKYKQKPIILNKNVIYYTESLIIKKKSYDKRKLIILIENLSTEWKIGTTCNITKINGTDQGCLIHPKITNISDYTKTKPVA